MKLFFVRTRGYKHFYVLGVNHEEALGKVRRQIDQEVPKSVITGDGSLAMPREDDNEIEEIRLIADQVVR